MCAFSNGGNPIKAARAGAMALLLAGCATGIADDDRMFQLGPKPAEPADFVRTSRPEKLDFVPVAAPVQDRAVPLKSKDQLAKAEADLAAKVSGNRAAAARGRPKSPFDGRIEPGYKPPRPQPVPESTWSNLKAGQAQKSLRKTVEPPRQ